MRLLIAASLALALAACSERETPGAGAVSPGEAKALEEAAAMLDERRLPPEVLSTDAQPAAAEMTGDAQPADR